MYSCLFAHYSICRFIAPFLLIAVNLQCSIDFQKSVLTKLETIIQKQDEGLSMLRVLLGTTRGVGGNDILEDILPKPMNDNKDTEDMLSRLEEDNFKKKMVCYDLHRVIKALFTPFSQKYPFNPYI